MGLERLFGGRFHGAIHLLDEALQHGARTEFGKRGGPVGDHVADDLGPTYRSGQLSDQVLFDLCGIGMGLASTF